MTSAWTPPPGSVGLARIEGPLGVAVGAGQWVLGDGCGWTHAFIVLDDHTVLEAMPSGARITPLLHYYYRETFVTPPPGGLDPVTAERVVHEARALEGVPYGFDTYAWLALSHLGIRPGWLRRRVSSGRSMMCSQLVDEVYRRAGVHLFDDDRIPGDVTPGDLAALLGALPPRS